VTPPHLRYLNPAFANQYSKQPPPFPAFGSLKESLHYRTTRYGLHKLLRYADRNGMAHGIEVRFPFLYHKLVEFVFALPDRLKIHRGWTKYVLRKSMEHRLPPSIAWRADKLGYTVPTKAWLEHPRVMEMVRDAQDHLAKRKIVKPDIKLNQRESTAVLIASRFI
ncbi:MAG TPA: asparagine synthase-related protein, partial [Chitinophagales bacterium]|nr:asparagine synthase-related protein [Chitinophagales bacterium]